MGRSSESDKSHKKKIKSRQFKKVVSKFLSDFVSLIIIFTLVFMGIPLPQIAAGEIDTDFDGLSDDWEIQYFGDITSYDQYDDPDRDGVPNFREVAFNTNPTVGNGNIGYDTDGDGVNDDDEIRLGSSPTNASSIPLRQCDNNTDPLNLANGLNVLFVDQSNCNCRDNRERPEALNPATPWCSLRGLTEYRPNHKLNPGDTVFIRRGDYTEHNASVNTSGAGPAQRITIQAYPSQTEPSGYEPVTIRGGSYNYSWILILNNASYITLKGLNFIAYEDTPEGRLYMPNPLRISGTVGNPAQDIQILDTSVLNFQSLNDIGYGFRWRKTGEDYETWGSAIQFDDVSNIKIENASVSCSEYSERPTEDFRFSGDGIQFNRVSGGSVKNSTFGNCGHISLTVRWSDNITVENNSCNNELHTCFAFGGSQMTIKNNLIYNWNVYPTTGNQGGHAIEMLSASDSQIHNNIIYYDADEPRRRSLHGITFIGNGDSNSDRNQVYHNLIYMDDPTATTHNSMVKAIEFNNRPDINDVLLPNTNYVHDNKVQNNIIQLKTGGAADGPYSQTYAYYLNRPIFFDIYGFEPNQGYGNEIKNNLLVTDNPGGFVMSTRNFGTSNPPYIHFDYTLQNLDNLFGTGTIVDNLGTVPLFVDPQNHDFHPTEQSSAVDAGICVPEVDFDFDNHIRPQGAACDIGPFEYVYNDTSDTDQDGLPDVWEMLHFGNLNQNGTDDPDNDQFINLQEFQNGTDPNNPDTDGDGYSDGEEFAGGFNPNDPNNHPSELGGCIAGSSDPQGLANGANVLFVDKNNCNCSDAGDRYAARDPYTPWCSPLGFHENRPNHKLNAGDTVYIRGGEYPIVDTTVRINSSGTSDSNRITFTSYPGETAVIRGAHTAFERTFVLNDVHFITFENLHFVGNVDVGNPNGKLYGPRVIEVVSGSSDIVFDSISVVDFKGTDDIGYDDRAPNAPYGNGIEFDNASNITVKNSFFRCMQVNDQINPDNRYSGDGIMMDYVSGGLIENNTFRDCGHILLVLRFNTHDVLVQNNDFSNTLHTNIAVGVGSHDNIIRNNTFHTYNSIPSETTLRANSIQILGASDNLIYNNVIYNGALNGNGISIANSQDQNGPGTGFFEANNNKIFHNTVYNTGYANMSVGNNGVFGQNNWANNNQIKNNIFYGIQTYTGEGEQIHGEIRLGGWDFEGQNGYGNVFENNWVKELNPAEDPVQSTNNRNTQRYHYTIDEFNALSFAEDNVDGNPLFVNAGIGDFHLQQDSPAIGSVPCLPEVAVDFDGNPRPESGSCAPGAFEYTSQSEGGCTVGSSDPQELANGTNMLFIDQNNCDCSDSYSRTQALDPNTPWCTPRALRETSPYEKLNIGDTVYIRGGDYFLPYIDANNFIVIRSSGTEANPITIRGYPNETVNLHGSSMTAQGSNIGIYMLTTYLANDITFDSLNFIGHIDTAGGRLYAPYVLGIQRSNGVKLKNISVTSFTGNDDIGIGHRWPPEQSYAEPWANGIKVLDTDGVEIDNLNLNCTASPSLLLMNGGGVDGIVGDDARNTTIKNSWFGDCGHGTVGFRNSENVLIENNTFRNRFHTSFGIGSIDGNPGISQNTIIRNNTFFGTNQFPSESNHRGGAIQIGPGKTERLYIYNNVIYDGFNDSTGITLVANVADQNLIQDVYIFNNTIHSPGPRGIYTANFNWNPPDALNAIYNVRIWNNILMDANHDYVSPVSFGNTFNAELLMLHYDPLEYVDTNFGGYGDDIRNNLIYSSNPAHETSVIRALKDGGGNGQIVVSGLYSVADFNNFNLADSNIQADPQFVDLANADFNLQPGSPASHSGMCLNVIENGFNVSVTPTGSTGCHIGAFASQAAVQPVLAQPATPNDGDFNLAWTPSLGSNAYEIKISTDPNFASNVTTLWSNDTFVPVSLSTSNTYHARVRGWESPPVPPFQLGRNPTEYSNVVQFVVDLEPPSGTILIENDAAVTYSLDSHIYLTVSDSGGSSITSVIFSNNGTIWSDPTPYENVMRWKLASGPSGERTVFARLIDSVGNISAIMQDTIYYEAGWTCSVDTVNPGSNPECNPICGDGLVVGNETCDDGNTASGDGCSSICQVEGPSHSINATANNGGYIVPNGTVNVAEGSDQIFTITPNIGYEITDVLVDSVSQGAISSYTFNNVQTTHTIEASFSVTTTALCGDGICEAPETVQTCSQDCAGTCGDGYCDLRRESHFDCSNDCAGNYYVVDANNPACSNSGPGSLAQPICNVSATFDQLNPGDTVYIRGGTQPFGSYNLMDRGGAPNQWVTIRNYPGETPVIDSGASIPSNWTFSENAGNYSIWWTDTSLGTYDPNANGGEGNYPRGIIMDLERPFSRMLRHQDMLDVLTIPNSNTSFNAYFIDCTSGRLYIRLPSGTNPSEHSFYFPGQNRFYTSASYIRFIGLTIQHGEEGIKMNPLPGGNPGQYIEVYDSTLRSLNSMGIADLTPHPTIDNYFTYQNNRFENIGPLVIADDSSYPVEICLSEISDPWQYTYDRYGHVIYGHAAGNLFSNNITINAGLSGALQLNRNSRYYNNYINGTVGGIGSNIEFFNNVVDASIGKALSLDNVQENGRFYNNLLIGNGYDSYVVLIGAEASPSSAPNIQFLNNIVYKKEAAPAYCAAYFNYTDFAAIQHNNNIYIDCQYFAAGGIEWSSPDPITNFNNWRSFLNGVDTYSSLQTATDVLMVNFSEAPSVNDYDLHSESAAIDAGFPMPNLHTDVRDRPRDAQTDIGPYEYQSTLQNENPTVDLGNDQTVAFGTSAIINGGVTDDGLPNPPGAVTVSWSQVTSSGGIATFNPPNNTSTSVTFSHPGSYQLRLTADDSMLTGSDDIMISVNFSAPPGVSANPPSPNLGAFNLEWDAVPGAAIYQVQLSPDPNFVQNIDERWPSGIFEPFVISQTGTYYARVQAWSQPPQDGGFGSGFSPAITIVVQACLTDANCSDNNTCNGTETCVSGSCQPGTPLACDDGNLCNGTETCDSVLGCQLGAPLNCGDADACNGIESCDPTLGCLSGVPLNCDDGIACTNDSCDSLSGCVHTTDNSVCSDGLFCTGAEICNAALGCQSNPAPCSGPNLICDETNDQCTGCLNDSDCDDSNACNGTETCQAGICTAGTSLVCDDGNICNGTETCDSALGCQSGIPLTCDDGNVCNGPESCDSTLGCQTGAPLVCDDGNPCTAEACDPATGCESTPVVDGMSCSDGLFCTGAEICIAGICQNGTEPCSDPDHCDEPNDQCFACISDSECGDGNLCNGAEACVNNTCQAGTPLVCDDANVCNGTETCDPGLGCQASAPLVCDDGVSCTNDSCDSVNGCANTPDDSICSDGLFCNGSETCNATAGCQSGTSACDTGEECDEANDMCICPEGAPCNPLAFTITASASEGGQISPVGDVVVNEGDNATFTITPDSRYEIQDVLVNSTSVGAVSSYTFNNVTSDHTIEATFAVIPESPATNGETQNPPDSNPDEGGPENGSPQETANPQNTGGYYTPGIVGVIVPYNNPSPGTQPAAASGSGNVPRQAASNTKANVSGAIATITGGLETLDESAVVQNEPISTAKSLIQSSTRVAPLQIGVASLQQLDKFNGEMIRLRGGPKPSGNPVKTFFEILFEILVEKAPTTISLSV